MSFPSSIPQSFWTALCDPATVPDWASLPDFTSQFDTFVKRARNSAAYTPNFTLSVTTGAGTASYNEDASAFSTELFALPIATGFVQWEFVGPDTADAEGVNITLIARTLASTGEARLEVGNLGVAFAIIGGSVILLSSNISGAAAPPDGLNFSASILGVAYPFQASVFSGAGTVSSASLTIS